jgi:uncharacterized protein (DUF4415 family)
MSDSHDFSKGKRGPVVPTKGKMRITLFVDDDVLAQFRERASVRGMGYQTLINETLRASLSPEAEPVTVAALRQVLREELHAA